MRTMSRALFPANFTSNAPVKHQCYIFFVSFNFDKIAQLWTLFNMKSHDMIDNYRITNVCFDRFFIYLQGTEELWPYLLLLNIVPALASVCILPLLPESPRYLMLTCNKLLEAKKGIAHR